MLALLDRTTNMIAADSYLSDTTRLGKTGGGVKVFPQWPVPRPDYPCLILACRTVNQVREFDASLVTLLGWLLTTKDAATDGRVLNQLDSIYINNQADPPVGIKPLLHENAVGICDPSVGLNVWTMREVFRANTLSYYSETGEFSMAFGFAGLAALE